MNGRSGSGIRHHVIRECRKNRFGFLTVGLGVEFEEPITDPAVIVSASEIGDGVLLAEGEHRARRWTSSRSGLYTAVYPASGTTAVAVPYVL